MGAEEGQPGRWPSIARNSLEPYSTAAAGVARKTAMRKPFGEAGSSNWATNPSWPESLRPSSQKVRFWTVAPSSVSPVAITRSATGSGPTKIPLVEKSSSVARKATAPALFWDGGRKPKDPKPPRVSATVLRGPPLPVAISSTNCWVASSKKDR